MLRRKPICFLIGLVTLNNFAMCAALKNRQPVSHFVPEFNHNSFNEQPREAEDCDTIPIDSVKQN